MVRVGLADRLVLLAQVAQAVLVPFLKKNYLLVVDLVCVLAANHGWNVSTIYSRKDWQILGSS